MRVSVHACVTVKGRVCMWVGVWVFLNACVRARMCACMCVHVRACACMCVHVCACMCVCVLLRVGVGACGCVHACLSYYTGDHQNLFVIFLMYSYVSLSAND